MHVTACEWCAAPFVLKQLSYHFYGNYFMQTLLAVASHVRAVAGAVGSFSAAPPETVRAAARGFGDILSALAGDYADMSVHPQANYVMDALLGFCSDDELAVVAEELARSFIKLVTHRWGHKLLLQAVERMVRVVCRTPPPRRMHCAVREYR
jgi:hypothetical protein